MFPEKIFIDWETYRTTAYNKVPDWIFKNTNVLQEQKKEETDENSVSSFSVPGAGIEPAQHRCHWCLRPARLPIPPSGPTHDYFYFFILLYCRSMLCLLTSSGWRNCLPFILALRGPDIPCRDLSLGPAIRAELNVLQSEGLRVSYLTLQSAKIG